MNGQSVKLGCICEAHGVLVASAIDYDTMFTEMF